MRLIHALSVAPSVNDWLANSRQPRILHVFDRACNLINERQEILSIVTPQIGNGPFNLVVEDEILFSEYLNIESPLCTLGSQLTLGDLAVNRASAKLWNPCPDWKILHHRKDIILARLIGLQITNNLECGLDTSLAKNARDYSTTASLHALISNLSSALATADLTTARKISFQLAGLGIGLTPAGDDFILGGLYTAWIIHPPEIASILAREIANAAAPLTTSLSAAWLRSAGTGEAGISWHELFDALITASPVRIQQAIGKILAVGETSGADALSGFVGTLLCWGEFESHKIH